MDAQHGVVRLHEADTKAAAWVAVDQITTIQPVIEQRGGHAVMYNGTPKVIGSMIVFNNGRELLVVEKPDYVFGTTIWRGAWGQGVMEEDEVDG